MPAFPFSELLLPQSGGAACACPVLLAELLPLANLANSPPGTDFQNMILSECLILPQFHSEGIVARAVGFSSYDSEGLSVAMTDS